MIVTAHETYASVRKEIDLQLRDIHAALKDADRQASKSRDDWGHAGNMQRVREQLREVLEFLENKR